MSKRPEQLTKLAILRFGPLDGLVVTVPQGAVEYWPPENIRKPYTSHPVRYKSVNGTFTYDPPPPVNKKK